MTVITHIAYLIAAICFIMGLKLLSSPKTARRGNLLGALGMLIAVVVTLANKGILSYSYIIAGLIIGGLIGAVLAKKVQMTAMPQMVGMLNGFGGGASALVAYAEYLRIGEGTASGSVDALIALVLSLLIGSLTFTGSMIAFAKLQGIMSGAPVLYKMQKQINALMLLAALVLGVVFILDISLWQLLLVIVVIALILGVTSVIPIGGADMPVVVSLLNSYSGIAAAATGFVLSNNVLIVCGTLVGSAGLILTSIMCKAMNRSLGNVLFAGVGVDYDASTEAPEEQRTVIRYTPEDVAYMLENAQSVIIIPG